jgi:hypothetical protein
MKHPWQRIMIKSHSDAVKISLITFQQQLKRHTNSQFENGGGNSEIASPPPTGTQKTHECSVV